MLSLEFTDQLKILLVAVSAVAILILIGMHAAPVSPSP
jgi:hypothetical protein